MADTIPERPKKCPPSNRNAVRHDAGTLSAISPESCPPWAGTRTTSTSCNEVRRRAEPAGAIRLKVASGPGEPGRVHSVLLEHVRQVGKGTISNDAVGRVPKQRLQNLVDCAVVHLAAADQGQKGVRDDRSFMRVGCQVGMA